MPSELQSWAGSASRLRVLVVDDEATVRKVLAGYLDRRGHAVTAVGSVADALATLTTATFDVVVTDVLLPDGDGLDLLNHISTNHLAPRVVCVTGGGRYFGPEFFQRIARALGATVLQKPFGSETFVAAVEGRPGVMQSGEASAFG